MTTKGQKRVGINFNVAEGQTKSIIDMIKHKSAELIDLIDSLEPRHEEVGRWKAEAMTCIETGAMFGVKAAVA